MRALDHRLLAILDQDVDDVAAGIIDALAAGGAIDSLAIRFHDEAPAVAAYDLSGAGCHGRRNRASVLAAQMKSLRVRPPASWVLKFTTARL